MQLDGIELREKDTEAGFKKLVSPTLGMKNNLQEESWGAWAWGLSQYVRKSMFPDPLPPIDEDKIHHFPNSFLVVVREHTKEFFFLWFRKKKTKNQLIKKIIY